MIDSSEHVRTQLAAAIAEIERLRGYEIAARDLSNDLTRVAKERDELQEANTNFAFQASDQAQEIERLRASLIDLHAEYINTLEKNPGCSAWDLDEQSDADQRRLRRNAAHAISITEPPIYLQAEQLAAHIQELETWLKKERSARLLEKSGSIRLAYLTENDIDFDEFFDGMALEQLQAEGKISIGDHIVETDQMVPNGKCWQITEERKAAIDRGLQFLEWSYAKNSAHDTKEQIAVLWAMLEASQ
jgi:hypothetical protein